MLSTFNGIYLLIERGMVSDTKVLSRTLIRTFFVSAVAKDKETADLFYQQNILLKYESLKKLMDSDNVTQDRIDDLKRLSELKKLIHEENT